MKQAKNNIKVLFASAEVAPFAKVGGLADVAGALPQALKNLGVDIRIIMPLHKCAKKILTEKKYKTKKIIRNFPVEYGGKIEKINVYEAVLNNNNVETRHCLVSTDYSVPVYFIDHTFFTSAKEVYKNENKFLFFSKAVAELATSPFPPPQRRGNYSPSPLRGGLGWGFPDIIHCNDNHTALIPLLIKKAGFINPAFRQKKSSINPLASSPKFSGSAKSRSIREGGGIKTIFTIHNLMHQGKISCEDLKLLNISKENVSSLKKDSENGDINHHTINYINSIPKKFNIAQEKNMPVFLEKGAQGVVVNKMVQGILLSDIINTVSPTYAKEILTQEYGEGLEKILQMRKRDLYGIINGIDTEKLNPENDPLIPYNYSIKNLEGKKKCKEELIKKYWKIIPSPLRGGLGRGSQPKFHTLLTEKSPLPPLCERGEHIIGLVSRLDSQKGIDLVIGALPELFKKHPDIHFILLGTGLPEYENQLKILAEKYPENFKALIKFDIKTAQEIYAGSDIFLMPSKFEPCGLGQLTAMRYGTVPIVRKTGGLADTVQNAKLKTQNSKLQNDANGFMFKEYSVSALLKAIEQALNIYQDKKMWKQLMKNGMRRESGWEMPAKEYLRLYKHILCN